MRFRITLTNDIAGSYTLTKMPKGINDIFPVITRGENHGLTIETDVKLEFFCNGAGKEFIDQVREDQGVDAEVLINIEAFCGCEPGTEAPDYSIDYADDYGSIVGGGCDEDYDDFYLGALELKTWETKDGLTKVNIKPQGILETVKNRLDTKVDLFGTETIDGDTITPYTYQQYELNLHSKAILVQASLTTLETPAIRVDAYVPDPPNDTMYVQMVWDYLEADEIGSVYEPSDTVTSTGASVFPSPLYTNLSGADVTVDLTYDLQGFLTDIISYNRSYSLGIVYRVANDADFEGTIFTVGNIVDYGTQNVLSSEVMIQEVDEQGSVNLAVPNGYSVYVTWVLANYDNNNASPQIATIAQAFNVCDLDIGIISTTAASTGKACLVGEAGSQITRSITGLEDSFRSEYFGRVNSEPYAYADNGCGSFRAFISGFMARNFPITGSKARTIRMSMNEYFNGLNAIDNLGMGIEKVGDDYYVVIEPKSYFYDVSTTMMIISNIPHLKRTEAPDYYYNRVNIGYDKWEIEFTNGLDEFNSKRQYDTGIKSIDNPLTIESELVASGYRLEMARRNQYSDTFTEDGQYDEDNFIVCLSNTVDYITNEPTELDIAEKDENFSWIDNVLSPETSYNLRLTPEMNFLRWSPVINAGLTKYEGREIKFTSGEGNYKTETAIDGVCSGNWNNQIIYGGQNIQWDDDNNIDQTPIWLPEIIEFSYPLKFSEYKIIEANPKGVFEVSELETDYVKGFILELKYVPNGVSTFKLLKAFV
jgi:hypothetical protein